MALDAKQILKDATQLRAAKDNTGAARLLEQVLVDDPGLVDIRVELVRALYAAGKVDAARAASRPLEDVVINETSWRKLFSLFRSVQDDMRAQLVTLRLLKIVPRHEEATAEFIKLLIDGKRKEQALIVIEETLKTPSLSPALLNTISHCQIRLQRFVEAAATAQRGLEFDRTSFDCRFGLVKALHQMKKDREIRRHMDALADLAGEDARRWGRIAEAASWTRQTALIQNAEIKVSALPNVPASVRVQIARAYVRVQLNAAALASLEMVKLDECDNLGVLKDFLNCVDDLIKAHGFIEEISRLGAVSARRLIELSDPLVSRVEYGPKLTGYENALKNTGVSRVQ